MAFVDSDTWRKLLETPYEVVSLLVIQKLNRADVESLLRFFRDGSAAEQGVAFEILRTLSRRSHELPELLWNESLRTAFVELLRERTQEHYAGTRPWNEPWGSSIRMHWAILDAHGHARFMMAQPLAGLVPGALKESLELLGMHARADPEVRLWLEAAVGAGGPLRDGARQALERVGLVSAERIEHWGRLWRETKDRDALDWLYDCWLSYLPKGYPKEQLLEVLGPPDEGEIPDLYYGTAGSHVYVEVYEATGFSGCHRA